MMNVSFDKRVLFLVVGLSCNLDKKQYLDLLGKTINESCSDTIYLLASKTSKERAEQIENAFRNSHEIVIVDCCEAFDVDKCYEEFEKIFSKVIKSGVSPDNIVIDFTHGTKPMSVALYAIGMRYKISDFQYIERNIRKDEDVFNDGMEIVKTFDASYAKWLSIIDECKGLFKNWQFSAIEILLSNQKISKKLKGKIDQIKYLVNFYSAWDRLNYKQAMEYYPEFESDEFAVPGADVKNLLRSLNEKMKEPNEEIGEVLSENDLLRNKELAVNLMFDIYANGLRRLESGQLEDAGIRVYKMAELLGQIYLFDAGYMSNHMSASDDDVRKFAEIKKWAEPKKDVYKAFGRKEVLEFLNFISYSHLKVEFLKQIEKDVDRLRNKSILIHGYVAQANDREAIKNLFEKIIIRLSSLPFVENFASKKEAALFMNKFKELK